MAFPSTSSALCFVVRLVSASMLTCSLNQLSQLRWFWAGADERWPPQLNCAGHLWMIFRFGSTTVVQHPAVIQLSFASSKGFIDAHHTPGFRRYYQSYSLRASNLISYTKSSQCGSQWTLNDISDISGCLKCQSLGAVTEMLAWL